MDEQTRNAVPVAPGRRGMRERIRQRAWVRSAALVGGGLIAGGILAGTVTATAADDGTGAAPASAEDRHGGDHDGRHDGRHGGPGAGEEELTGDTAESVEAAVLEEYPDATIERMEIDSDGVYEAHLTTADGDEVTVELDEDFAIIGIE